MAYTLFIIAVILVMLLLERIVTVKVTRLPACQRFIRHHLFLHPNGISLLRIPQGAIAIWLASRGHWDWGILWFAFWMITDLTDGTIARTCDLETPTGKWLDPLADKCMSFPALFYLSLGTSPNVISPKLPLEWVIAYCTIDIIGQCSRLFCSKKAANSFGKVKTALVTVLISILALNQLRLPTLTFLNDRFVGIMTIACTILAFLSLYCKVIPNHWYANTLTFLNFACGILAIWVAWFPSSHYHFILAFVLIFAGQFFDLFDGRMARKYGSTLRGPIFDDIADGTSFGLANGSIIFLCFSQLEYGLPSYLAVLLALFYLACVIYRLIRFIKPTKALPHGIFQGLPSPAGALLAGSSVIAGVQMGSLWATYVSAAIVLLAACLMISDLAYRHFGQDLWPSLPRPLRILFLILSIVFICFALVYRGWAQAFTWFTATLSVLYALGAIAPPGYLETLFAKQAKVL